MTNPFADSRLFELVRTSAMSGTSPVLVAYSTHAPTQLSVDDRTMRMVMSTFSTSRALLLVGPPGTGKTELLRRAFEAMRADPIGLGFGGTISDLEIVTPDQDWTYADLVIGDRLVAGDIRSVEGALLGALRRNEMLAIDEANRADMDRIFGGLLTWLAGGRVRIGTWVDGTAEPYPVYLDWGNALASEVQDEPGVQRTYLAGTDFRMLGTYNAVDAQRVFRIGQALSRRFKHVPIAPIDEGRLAAVLESIVDEHALRAQIIDSVLGLYRAHQSVVGAALGPALFLEIPAYVRCVLGQSDSVELMHQALAEGYVVNVGAALSRWDPRVVEELGEMAVSVAGVTRDSWEWIQSTLVSMRA